MPAIVSKPRSWYQANMALFRPRSAQSRADRTLATQIAGVFENVLSPTDVESICFYVRERNVTVFGSICQPQSRPFIIALLRRIPGIREVNDHLQSVAYEEVF